MQLYFQFDPRPFSFVRYRGLSLSLSVYLFVCLSVPAHPPPPPTRAHTHTHTHTHTHARTHARTHTHTHAHTHSHTYTFKSPFCWKPRVIRGSPVKARRRSGCSHAGFALRVQELCESRDGRPEFPVLMSLMVSVDVK